MQKEVCHQKALQSIETKMEKEVFSLKWNNFQDNIQSIFRDLRLNNDFADVTLVCGDGQQMKTHKVILAAFSPFFSSLLKTNIHPHPLIYLHGIKAADLVAIMDFLYHGEANVCQENLDGFLTLAEELKLKGLQRATEADNENVLHSKENKLKKENPDKITFQPNQNEIFPKLEEQLDPSQTSLMKYTNNILDPKQLDEQINSMMGVSEVNEIRNRKARICNVCGKEGDMSNIKSHIEVHHITGVTHSCDICGKSFKARTTLVQHKIQCRWKNCLD